MASYYFLMSSLPMLRSEGELPLRYSEFLERCESAVDGRKFALLQNLSLSSADGPLISEWAKFYGVFHNELTFQRNQRLGRPATVPTEREESIVRIVTAALNEKNLLTAENMLLAFQFEKLDELIGIHYFDDYSLMGYALKLKLLERKTVFKQEKGKAELNGILKHLEHEVMSIR